MINEHNDIVCLLLVSTNPVMPSNTVNNYIITDAMICTLFQYGRLHSERNVQHKRLSIIG